MNEEQINSTIGIYPLPNAYPGMDLARAVLRFLGLKKRAGAAINFDRKELVEVLGFGPNSGGANMVISALIHFGLLRRVETNYHYTDLGNRLLAAESGSEEYTKALLEALRSPELYRWLNGKYDRLPDEIEDILIGRYHNRGVKSSNVKGIIANYLKSVTFANTQPGQSDDSVDDDYVSINVRENKILVYKKYLLEAINKTRDDELAKVYESLR